MQQNLQHVQELGFKSCCFLPVQKHKEGIADAWRSPYYPCLRNTKGPIDFTVTTGLQLTAGSIEIVSFAAVQGKMQGLGCSMRIMREQFSCAFKDVSACATQGFLSEVCGLIGIPVLDFSSGEMW